MEDQVLELMRAMDRARRGWRNASPGDRLNKSQFFTMLTLRHQRRAGGEAEGAMTLSELSRALHQTMPAVSQRISRLEELGYVRRTQDDTDRRTVWIALTGAGEAVVEETRQAMVRYMEQVMDRMEAAQPRSVEQLIRGCNCLADALNAQPEA